jgi:hypothetical protein
MSRNSTPVIFSVLLAFSFFVISGILPAAAQSVALDGKTFSVKVGQTGKIGHEDELIFAHRTFKSTAFVNYGFGSGPYTTISDANTTTFNAVTTNKHGAKMKWLGTISGKHISGEMTLYEEGKMPVKYWFNGKLDS